MMLKIPLVSSISVENANLEFWSPVEVSLGLSFHLCIFVFSAARSSVKKHNEPVIGTLGNKSGTNRDSQ